MTETVGLIKPKTFIIWLFMEKLLNPCCRGKMERPYCFPFWDSPGFIFRLEKAFVYRRFDYILKNILMIVLEIRISILFLL